MRSIIILQLFVVLNFVSFSQETIQKKSEVKTSTGVSTKIDESLFISKSIPEDLPKRSEFKSDETYRKVIQGYINIYTDKIDPVRAKELGFTIPEVIEIKSESELRQEAMEQRKRKEPISEEERRLKEERSKK